MGRSTVVDIYIDKYFTDLRNNDIVLVADAGVPLGRWVDTYKKMSLYPIHEDGSGRASFCS